jgi:hypothetical protein
MELRNSVYHSAVLESLNLETVHLQFCVHIFFLNLNPGQPRTLLQLKRVGILMINLFLT